MPPLSAVGLPEVRDAARRLAPHATRTPLLPLEVDSGPIHVKLENLQPIGSFKIRGAGNALLSIGPEALAGGVSTASAGNMGRAVAWHATRLGVPCSVLVPDSAPSAKLEPLRRLGARVVAVTFPEWWQALADAGHPELSGQFVHPVADARVMAGNATIGLELVEQVPELSVVVIPFGGGGLACGIASALRALRRHVRVVAAEVEGAAPLTAALRAGRPVTIEHRRTWIDGIGSGGVLEQMWPLASALLDATVVVSPEEVAAAIRLLAAGTRTIAEGAGAAAVAGAVRLAGGEQAQGPVVAVVSGGLIEPQTLARILRGSA